MDPKKKSKKKTTLNKAVTNSRVNVQKTTELIIFADCLANSETVTAVNDGDDDELAN